MKTKSNSPILLAPLLMLCCLLAVQIFATQISFVPSPPPRTPNQQGQQQGQQGQPQRGLSPEKKKSLSKYGPEDVFPGAREQDEKNKTSNRQPTRRSTTAAPSPTISSPSPAPAAAKAVPTIAPPTPAATQLASAMAMQQPPAPASASSTSRLVPVALSVASLLVFCALIYVLGMLRKKLREGR
jgi:hypothetical protein